MEQWQISEKKFISPFNPVQAETSLSTCYHTYTRLGILIAGEAKEKEELKNLLMWGKLSVHVIVVREFFTFVKNKK